MRTHLEQHPINEQQRADADSGQQRSKGVRNEFLEGLVCFRQKVNETRAEKCAACKRVSQ